MRGYGSHITTKGIKIVAKSYQIKACGIVYIHYSHSVDRCGIGNYAHTNGAGYFPALSFWRAMPYFRSFALYYGGRDVNANDRLQNRFLSCKIE